MPYIEMPDAPGIMGPMMFRPQTAGPLFELAEVLLRGPSTLSRGEREIIAAYVSRLNQCTFCHHAHATFAALQLDDGGELVDAVLEDPDSAPISAKLRALLALAALVTQSGLAVTEESVQAARDQGATDIEIHDTVLIAAAFCMYNRYVDGLGAVTPAQRADYSDIGQLIVGIGYAAATPAVPTDE
ncbi:MAG: peroxidase-related enzyme [Mycobacterium sp.]|nr:peroxidase-related enzyme [Mycobacterium sp.]